MDLGDVFEDNDVSAFTVRKAFSAWGHALAAIERDPPDYLLVYRQDRIGRRLADIEGLEELCRRTGTKVHAAEGGKVFANPAWPSLATTVSRLAERRTPTAELGEEEVRRIFTEATRRAATERFDAVVDTEAEASLPAPCASGSCETGR